MKIISINVSLPVLQSYGVDELVTGIGKSPIPSARLHVRNFEGDGQADLVHHGSPDQAVCIYAYDHYPYWESRLGRRLLPGSFGENLTIQGALETVICIGDIFRAGEALVQVTQPRQPCAKIGKKLGEKKLPEWMIAYHASGLYLRVLQEGLVTSGEAFELVEAHPLQISIAMVDDLLYERSTDRALSKQLAALPEFSAAGRERFAKKL
jgi:MOSC domain-containing protein YiiM